MADDKKPTLVQLVYASSATEPFSERALRTLLLKARLNNERLGVTGMLLFESGSFLQVLEGPEPEVRALFLKLSADKRHDRVLKLSEKWLTEREFGAWSMGYVPSDRNVATQLRGFNDFFRWSAESSEPDADGAHKILQAFRDGRFRTNVEG